MPTRMLRLIGILIVLFGGATLGLASAKIALDRGLSSDLVRVGPWEMRNGAGLVSGDPYARAEAARSGAIPLASGEGLTLRASRASDGALLASRCAYLVTGATPAARFWSLTLFDGAGRPVANPAAREGFNSTELSRDAQGAFSIAVASSAQPGDWLPAPARGAFVLVLRLYDTPIGVGAALTPAQLPVITRRSCG